MNDQLQIAVNVRPQGPDGETFAVEADKLGVQSLWSAEAWGYDALTPLAYLAGLTRSAKLGTAIVQLGARSPAMLAMSAMSMQALSGGRFILGLGASGPQVIEGWHGARFNKPVQRTRETIDIIRMITSGEKLYYQGQCYQLPLPDSEGRSIRSMDSPVDVPIYIAALGPANLKLVGERADGWIGNSFIPESANVFFDPIANAATAVGRSIQDIDLTVQMTAEFSDDVEEISRRHAGGYAFTFGAMGTSKKNFYNDAFSRQGYGEAIAEVQRLWLAGDREAAANAVPAEIGLKTNLIGTKEIVRERLVRYRDAGVNTLRLTCAGSYLDAKLQTLSTILDLVREVNALTPAHNATKE